MTGLPRDKVLAVAVSLLDAARIRIGNHYLKDAMGEDFTAKDFRTWRTPPK